MRKVSTPLRYPGGKTRVADMLVSRMPEFKEYREPFIGGGSVFLSALNKFPNVSYWINDLYFDLYAFWETTKSNDGPLVRQILEWKAKYTDGKKLYGFLVDGIKGFNEIEKAAAFFILNRITFSGTTLSGGFSNSAFKGRFTESSIDRVRRLHDALMKSNVTITNLDYSELLSAEGNDVFIFMDPPYFTATKSALYGKNGELHKGFDHERFHEACVKCKHKWMITYDDCEYIRDLFSDYRIEPFGFKYGMKNVTKDADMDGHEILITNFDKHDVEIETLL